MSFCAVILIPKTPMKSAVMLIVKTFPSALKEKDPLDPDAVKFVAPVYVGALKPVPPETVISILVLGVVPVS